MSKFWKTLLLLVLKYVPIWQILDYLIEKLEDFAVSTKNTTLDDKAMEVVRYVFDAIHEGKVLNEFNEWLNDLKD